MIYFMIVKFQLMCVGSFCISTYHCCGYDTNSRLQSQQKSPSKRYFDAKQQSRFYCPLITQIAMLGVLSVILLSSCVPPLGEIGQTSVTQTAEFNKVVNISVQQTELPSSTVEPTLTSIPTSTPIPTSSPIPTSTHTPTQTHTKTSTSTYTPTPTATEEIISFPFNIDSGNNWRYVSDRVMGGVSDGQVFLEQDGNVIYARLTGNVSTRNRGGFIQLSSSSSSTYVPLMIQSIRNSEKNGKELQGVRLNVRGNGEIYYIFIRTNETRSFSDYYQASFVADADWEMIDLPFDEFVRNVTNIAGSDTVSDSKLAAKNIRSFGIMAYGRDFLADLSVSTVDFYY